MSVHLPNFRRAQQYHPKGIQNQHLHPAAGFIYNLHGCIHPRWLFGISEPSTVAPKNDETSIEISGRPGHKEFQEG